MGQLNQTLRKRSAYSVMSSAAERSLTLARDGKPGLADYVGCVAASATLGMTKRLGPDATLRRGYSMTMDPIGNVIRSVTQVKRGDRIHTRVTDGTFESNVA